MNKQKIFQLHRIIIVVTLFLITISANAQFKGKVYLDENRNGSFDMGEKLLPGIAVSNGETVVLTDKKGNYSLPAYKKARFVFVTIPAGYKSSGDFFARISENKNPDFGLVKYKRTTRQARFIQIADTETYEYGEWIDNLRDYSKFNDVGFIVHTGDICYVKGLKFHAEAINTKTMGLPVFYCIGNHDLVEGDYGEQLFESLFGPVYYSFDAGNTHFVVTPMRGGDYKPSYNNNQVFNWLKNDLKHVDPKMNLVVFNHDLLTYNNQFIFSGRGNKEINLNDRNLKAWIYGHWHINFKKQHGENGPVSVCASTPDKGGIDHSPSNFLVYDITENGAVNIAPRYSFLTKHIVINAPTGNEILLNEFGNLVVSVNTYHTISATKSVDATITTGAGKKIEFPLTQNSDWNWSTEIKPDIINLNIDKLKLVVKATFENNETAIQERSIRLIPEDNKQEIFKLQWVTNVKSNIWMAPSVKANGKLFVATIDDFGMKNCGIQAIGAESGLMLWNYKTEGSVKNTICYSNGKILATDVLGNTYAIDAETGKLIWKKELGKNGLGAFNTGSVVNRGIFYTGFGNYLQAIDVETGETRWVNEDWQGGEGATSTMTVAGDVLIAASNWRALYAHDIKTGKLLWKKSDDGYSSRSSSATFLNDTLYVASQKGIGTMNARTGEIYNYFETPYNLQVATKPIITGNTIIIGTSRDGMAAFDKKSGKEIWHLKTGKSLFYSAPYSKPESETVESAPVLFNGMVIFGASDGFLYAVNPETGKIIQKIYLGAPIFAPVTTYLKSFFVVDFAGNTYRFLQTNLK